MKTNSIFKALKSTVSKAAFGLKKHSPTILVITGIAGTIASTVMACKATTKISTILDKSKEEIEQIRTVAKDETISKEEYSDQDRKKDLTIVYVQTGIKLVKLYAPSIILGVLSVTSILVSNNILRKRNMALAAAYATIDKGFKEYRSHVVERFGEETDKELKYNIKEETFTESTVNENGIESVEKVNVKVAEPSMYSSYARFFDETNPLWEKNPDYNLMFLKAEQNYANDLLISRGYLFLNEVYDRLGIPKSKAGQVVGWIYDTKHPKGDNYVDFGIYDMNKAKQNEDFINGYERSILLDFNVDGDILNSADLAIEK